MLQPKTFITLAIASLSLSSLASAETLRLLTWGSYAPPALIQKFQKETGISVQVTLSDNEGMVSKLRATGGAGFDLVQPSQDRIVGPQTDFRLYKPIDMSKINSKLFDPKLLQITKAQSTIAGKVYALPYLWGSGGIMSNRDKAPQVTNIQQMCQAQYKGKIAIRPKRVALILMAFTNGDDPFAAYKDKTKYQAIMERAEQKLSACKGLLKKYWSNSDDLLSMMRSGEIVAAEAWDSLAFKLLMEGRVINYDRQPLGWIDTFTLPAKGRADAAAYKWINFIMRPENAAQVMQASSALSASSGAEALVPAKLRLAIAKIYPTQVRNNIKWYPPIPSGIEAIEGKILDRLAAQ